jgi:hypothetical protein
MMTEEQMYQRLLAARLDKPPAPKPVPPPKPAEVLAEERWSEDNISTAQVINNATVHTDALGRRLRQDEAEAVRARYQRELDQWWLTVQGIADDGYVQIGGFRERRRPSCHRGPSDSDW